MRKSDRMNQKGELRCSKCETFLPASSEFFHVCRTNIDGFHSQCKQCRAAYASKPTVREKRRLYKRDYMVRKHAELDGIQLLPRQGAGKREYRTESPIPAIKKTQTWLEFADELGTTVQTAMKWQREGAPQRFGRAAYKLMARMQAHYENLVVMEGVDVANEYFELCKKDGWDFLN